ncbi:hypothetical protein NDU88_000692 [Pleurodeles waltl]|uniref:Uncharacterized protein n=1 Tax=Pleurodeles waltl TaxID=8319 RepID=A0AAV7L7L3_PLEWA|nr:hypothetical protein NDU88_000692 [Pleurodeles waltl]
MARDGHALFLFFTARSEGPEGRQLDVPLPVQGTCYPGTLVIMLHELMNSDAHGFSLTWCLSRGINHRVSLPAHVVWAFWSRTTSALVLRQLSGLDRRD